MADDLINPADLEFSCLHSYPDVGGQHVGAARIVKVHHVPTGTWAIVSIGRSGHANREIAVDMILCALTHPKAW